MTGTQFKVGDLVFVDEYIDHTYGYVRYFGVVTQVYPKTETGYAQDAYWVEPKFNDSLENDVYDLPATRALECNVKPAIKELLSRTDRIHKFIKENLA